MAIDKKTTAISTNAQVEWSMLLDFSEDGLTCTGAEVVFLTEPQTEKKARDCIAMLRPRTALKLLAWLEQEQEKLLLLVEGA